MAQPAVYVVRTTLNPGVPYNATQAEYEYLLEQNILDSLDAVTVPADRVVISPTAPISPPIGQVWFNTSI